MKKLKISWVTENFIDVDYPIIVELSKNFDISWHISQRANSQYFKTEYIYNLALPSNVNKNVYISKSRIRNPKIFIHYLRIVFAIKKENYDIIYCNLLGMPYFFPLVNKLLPKNKIIYAAHDVIDHTGRKLGKFMTFYRNLIFKNFTNFHIFSETQKEIFVLKFPQKKYFVARLYKKDYGEATTINIKKPDLPIQLLFFGHIRYNKGLTILSEAANKIDEKYPGKLRITIAGNCDNWDEFKDLVQNAQLYTLMVRYIDNKEVPDLFNNCHYVVLPYLSVTQSGVLMVAYQYSIPVIATDFEEFRNDILDNETGYLITPDSASIYDLLEKLILESNSNYDKMQQNLKHYVEENINLQAIVEKYTVFFNVNFQDKAGKNT